MLEVREDGKDQPRDARLATARPFRPGAVVDAGVALEASVEEDRAGLSRLPVGCRQAEVAEHQHGVGGRDPLWRVEPAVRGQPTSPPALRVLPGEQTGPPAVARAPSPLVLDSAFSSPDPTPHRLPPIA